MSSRSYPPEPPDHPVLTALPGRGASAVSAARMSTLEMAFDAADCARARRWTTLQLEELDVRSSEVCEDAELIVSELVSNAVVHGAAPVVVTLSYTSARLEVSVTDGGGPPYQFGSRPHDPTATRGRGLAIVAALTPTWGVRALRPGPGKTVWCRLYDTAAAR